MARVSFTTSIDKDLQDAFKEKCKKDGLRMNEVIEAVMQSFLRDEFTVETHYKVVMKDR